jgi:hypothetical protein
MIAAATDSSAISVSNDGGNVFDGVDCGGQDT